MKDLIFFESEKANLKSSGIFGLILFGSQAQGVANRARQQKSGSQRKTGNLSYLFLQLHRSIFITLPANSKGI